MHILSTETIGIIYFVIIIASQQYPHGVNIKSSVESQLIGSHSIPRRIKVRRRAKGYA